MKIKIDFFSEDLVKAIGAGIYKASVIKPDGVCLSNENVSKRAPKK